jgi:hypothetical protein
VIVALQHVIRDLRHELENLRAEANLCRVRLEAPRAYEQRRCLAVTDDAAWTRERERILAWASVPE